MLLAKGFQCLLPVTALTALGPGLGGGKGPPGPMFSTGLLRSLP